MEKRTTVGAYLIHRLDELGVADVFGVPGDYVLGFYDLLVGSRLNVVGTCTEAGAGFATDAYARVNTAQFSIVNVHLDPYDRSSAMERLGKRLGERAALKRKPVAKTKTSDKSAAARGTRTNKGKVSP